MAPPPTRRSTLDADARRRGPGGSSAHAEINRADAPASPMAGGLLRPRGDQPLSRLKTVPLLAAPPPTRRSTHRLPQRRGCARGSSAHAEINRSTRRGSPPGGRLLRPRGDQPKTDHAVFKQIGAPPPTRRSTERVHASPIAVAGSSAHAEINRHVEGPRARAARLLRPRGDQPWASSAGVHFPEAPPPTRRSTPDLHRRLRALLGSSAHAEINPTRA